jgi:hypothetical protein
MNTEEEKFSKYFSETIYNGFEYYNMSILYVIFSSKYIFLGIGQASYTLP